MPRRKRISSPMTDDSDEPSRKKPTLRSSSNNHNDDIDATESAGSGIWGYEGERMPGSWWQKHYLACAKKHQSPIDISSSTCEGKHNNEIGKTFTLHGLKERLTVSVINNGHSIQSNLPKDANVNFVVDGTTYIVEQFHFHWGKPGSGKGSEHHIDGKSFPLELHVVAYDKQYKNVGDAADKRGLSVLGFLFLEGKDNKFLKKLMRIVPDLQIHHEGQKPHDVKGFRFVDLIGKHVLNGGYYRYSGSLTTPPCFEGVKWVIFRENLSVSAQQLNVFRTKTGITHNYRPVQPLNGRKIHCY